MARVQLGPGGLGAVAPAGDHLSPRRQHLDHLLGQVGGDELARRTGLEPVARTADEAVLGMHHADAEWRRHRHAGEPRLEVGLCRTHAAVVDAALSELRVGEQGVVRLEQRLVAPPVLAQRPLRRDLVLGLEIGLDVGATKRVDGLLGVSDEHQRGVATAEGGLHDLPLHGVGVLEFVDQHDVVALAQAGTCVWSAYRVTERVAQTEEDIVVRHDLERSLAPVHLLFEGGSEAHPHRVDVVALRSSRHDHRVGVVEHFAGDLERLGMREVVRIGSAGELAQVEVVDHLFHQVAHVLDQGDVTIDVTGGPQPVEHLQAEAVRGLDRGRVEVGDRLGQPVVPFRPHQRVRVGQQTHDLVVGRRWCAGQYGGQPVEGADQPLPHAFAELPRRHARERDDQELVDRVALLRDVARRQGGDGEGLARAGARLEQRHAARQRPADVEGLWVRGRAHRLRTVSCSSKPSHRTRA